MDSVTKMAQDIIDSLIEEAVECVEAGRAEVAGCEEVRK